ncbi:Aminoacylase-1 [Eumeta japonica]|uniref:N-acyl-aliphatic-L-amino acid amidohydrolase n=1 Tax=Eumeta variegata TaxID=151549 RepID=A0A4C1V8B0_EUMVA|nr:Aminoacylase-1 [Eumeta japonica]
MATKWENDPAVNNFRDYLRFPTVHPNINYDVCLEFLKRQAASLGLPARVYEPAPRKPVLVMSWAGTEPTLPSILLNSHMDVVPVFEKSWSHPPFAAHMDPDGTIYARGAQDMKCVGAQYLEALRKLRARGVALKRTVHVSFVSDEEIGMPNGMSEFVKTQEYRNLNVGFSLDEGMASPTDEYLVFYGERSIWELDIRCPGTSGHGSLILPNTAGEKIRYMIDKLMDLRAQEKKKLDDDPRLTVGDVTTVNLTKLRGGVQANVVPEELSATFNIRLALTVNHQEFENMVSTLPLFHSYNSVLRQWAIEAGEGVTLVFDQKDPRVESTKMDSSNPFWTAFKSATDKLNMNLKTVVFPAGTDSRFLRQLGVPALGFSPMNHTEVQLHQHNESLSAETFLRGIDIYVDVITALANVPE